MRAFLVIYWSITLIISCPLPTVTEASHLSEALRSQLQEAVAITGVIVISFQLSDLACACSQCLVLCGLPSTHVFPDAKEIASQMLARQQAHAIIDARKTSAL